MHVPAVDAAQKLSEEMQPVQVPPPAADMVKPGAGKVSPRPLPETLTAASDAAAFVAQLFAEVSTPEQAAPLAPVPSELPHADEAGRPGAENGVTAVSVPSGDAVVPPLQDRNVLVLGLGASGLAMFVGVCVRERA